MDFEWCSIFSPIKFSTNLTIHTMHHNRLLQNTKILQISIIFMIILIILAVLLNVKNRQSTEETTTIIIRGSAQNRSKNRQNIHIPKYMLDLYEKHKSNQSPSEDTPPDIVRSLIPKETTTFSRHPNPAYHYLIFDLPRLDHEETFTRAELKLLLETSSSDTKIELSIRLELDLYTPITRIPTNSTWLSFDVTSAVRNLYRASRHRLDMRVMTDAFIPTEEYPLLLLTYARTKSEPMARRVKRQLEEDYEEESNRVWDGTKRRHKKRNACRRKSLYIDFEQINYDLWIVQPKGYEAYQCGGRCFYPLPEHLSPTKHAIVQTLLHSISPDAAGRACCVPTRLGSISILYVDPQGVLTYRYAYDDMVVLECGCR